jgi:hypothetical protein
MSLRWNLSSPKRTEALHTVTLVSYIKAEMVVPHFDMAIPLFSEIGFLQKMHRTSAVVNLALEAL